MDIEFSILYRENETKRRKAATKDNSSSARKQKIYKDLYKA